MNPSIRREDLLRCKILIVDSQASHIRQLERTLLNAGHAAVTSALNAEKVCELHLLNRYDLILLELQMPGMDGFQVMENLKAIETGGYLPIFVVTAQAHQKLRALKAGARDFVSKPFDPEEVLIRMHNLLEVRLLNLANLRLFDRLIAEQKVAEQLLRNVLPQAIAECLGVKGEDSGAPPVGPITGSYAEVAVLFSDILEFTRFAEGASAVALRGVLDAIATRFDSRDGEVGARRTRILGEAYLASMGLSGAVAERTIRASKLALDMIEAVDHFNGHSRHKLRLSIGMEPSAGAPCAGKQKAPTRL